MRTFFYLCRMRQSQLSQNNQSLIKLLIFYFNLKIWRFRFGTTFTFHKIHWPTLSTCQLKKYCGENLTITKITSFTVICQTMLSKSLWLVILGLGKAALSGDMLTMTILLNTRFQCSLTSNRNRWFSRKIMWNCQG